MNNSPFFQYPQPGFAGGPPTPLIPKLTPELAAKLANVDLKQTVDFCADDTKYFKAGTAVSGSDLIFFALPINSLDTLGNDSTVQFSKTPMSTNMVQNGQLQRGETLVVTSLQALITIPGNLDVTTQSTGNTTLPLATGTNATLDATHSGIVMGNLYNAIAKSGVIRFKVGNNFFENGPLEQFPAEFGASGFNSGVELGTVTAGSNISTNDGIINNGFGFPRQLAIPRTIVAGQNFGVYLNFYNLFNPGRNFDIQIILRGLLYRDIS